MASDIFRKPAPDLLLYLKVQLKELSPDTLFHINLFLAASEKFKKV